jgi:hypothetical protein
MNNLFFVQKFPPGLKMTKRSNFLVPDPDKAVEARPVSFDLLVKDVSAENATLFGSLLVGDKNQHSITIKIKEKESI